jgi:hypothetical protein
MEGPGFHMDLDALAAAAGGIRDTIRDRDSIEVRNICGPAELYGHAGVHGAFSDFCDRWSAGVDQLVETPASSASPWLLSRRTTGRWTRPAAPPWIPTCCRHERAWCEQ